MSDNNLTSEISPCNLRIVNRPNQKTRISGRTIGNVLGLVILMATLPLICYRTKTVAAAQTAAHAAGVASQFPPAPALPFDRDAAHSEPSCQYPIVLSGHSPNTEALGSPTPAADRRPAKGYGSTRTTPRKFLVRAARKLREKANTRNFTADEQRIFSLAAAVVDAVIEGRPQPYEFAAQQQTIQPTRQNVTRFEISPAAYFAKLDARAAEPTELDGRTATHLLARAAAWLNFQATDADQGKPFHMQQNADRDALLVLHCVSTGRPLPEKYRKQITAPAPLMFSKSEPKENRTHAQAAIAL